MLKGISRLGLALSLCACSSLKTASLRDARVLAPGQSEIAAEMSTSGPIERAFLKLAAKEYPEVKTIIDSMQVQRPESKTDMPLFGAYFSHGLSHGMEVNVGASTSLTPGGAVLADAGFKKRIYADRHFAFAAYARLAGGYAHNIMYYGAPDTLSDYPGFELSSKTLEGDAVLMSLIRIFPMLSIYGNVGYTAGGMSFSFSNILDTAAGRVKGYVPLSGIKNHIGIVLEFKETEIALEQGFLFYNHGYVPSLGLRWSLKDGWKQ